MSQTTPQHSTISYDEWLDQYEPILDSEGSPRRFDIVDSDLQALKEYNRACIWTELDVGCECEVDEDGESDEHCGHSGLEITSGVHFVNRMAYYVTAKPVPEGVMITVEDD